MILITDKELAAFLRVSVATICRAAKGRFLKNGVDLRKANPIIIQGSRRWNIKQLAKILDVDVADIAACVK